MRMIMTLTRTATVFALAVGLTACSTLPAGRDFNTLTLGEQVDFSTCVLNRIGSSMTPNGNSAGAMLDSLLAKPDKIQDATRNAANICAVKMWINPNSVPGLR